MKFHAEIIKSGLCRTNVAAVHRPSPSLFYYPGLSSRSIYPKTQFTNVSKVLQDNYGVILSEYQNFKSKSKSDYHIQSDEHQLHNGNWEWYSYVLKGKRQTNFAVNCPQTTEILESLNHPKLMIDIPFSYAFFSTLGSQTTIKPHYGPCNLRVRCHFPLIVPSGDCGMKIGGTDVKWEVNEPIYFDDTYEHTGISHIVISLPNIHTCSLHSSLSPCQL